MFQEQPIQVPVTKMNALLLRIVKEKGQHYWPHGDFADSKLMIMNVIEMAQRGIVLITRMSVENRARIQAIAERVKPNRLVLMVGRGIQQTNDAKIQIVTVSQTQRKVLIIIHKIVIQSQIIQNVPVIHVILPMPAIGIQEIVPTRVVHRINTMVRQ